MRALISGGAFSTARRAVTTSQPTEAAADEISDPNLGTLLPPEGQGQLPGTGELPPPIGPAPQGETPRAPSPASSAPRLTPAAVPSGRAPLTSAPVSSAPRISSPAPQSSTPQSSTPQSSAPKSLTPAAASSGSTAQGSVPTQAGNGTSSSTGGFSTSSSAATTLPGSVSDDGQNYGQTGQISIGQTSGRSLVTPGQNTFGQAPVNNCCCSSHLAMISLVAQVSTTAQASLTAITAIARME